MDLILANGHPDDMIGDYSLYVKWKERLPLKNSAAKGNQWLGLTLEGVACNRDAIGAKVFWTPGGVKCSRLKTSGGSYLSSHDPRLVPGIGSAAQIESLEIHWPLLSKQVDRFTNIPVNRYVRVVEGKGVIS